MQTGPLLDEAYVATDKMVVIFRHFPLNIHSNALPAARAAYCAGQQAPQWFWAMHDWLFANQNAWANAGKATEPFRRQALALGVDAARYDACLKDALTEARIRRDLQEGNALGVRGTPAFFLYKVDAQGQTIATRGISGALPFEQFDQALKALLNP